MANAKRIKLVYSKKQNEITGEIIPATIIPNKPELCYFDMFDETTKWSIIYFIWRMVKMLCMLNIGRNTKTIFFVCVFMYFYYSNSKQIRINKTMIQITKKITGKLIKKSHTHTKKKKKKKKAATLQYHIYMHEQSNQVFKSKTTVQVTIS